MPVHALCAAFLQECCSGLVPLAVVFGAFIWCMHFRVYFLCPRLAFLSMHIHTHTFPVLHPQGRMEYLVKWKGWSQK